MYCKNCNVEIEGTSRVCPLCHQCLDGDDQTFPIVKRTKKRQVVTYTQIYLILFTLISIPCLVVNLVLDSNLLWSLAVIGSLMYLYLFIGTIFFTKSHIASKIFVLIASLALFAGLLQNLTPTVNWATIYVVPFIIIVGVITQGIFALVSKKPGTFLFSLIFSAIAGVIPIAYTLPLNEKILWPSISCASICGFVLILLLMWSCAYGKGIIWSEIKRKFHA